MNSTSFQTIKRTDYQPPGFLVDTVHLRVVLDECDTLVTNTMHLRRNPEGDAGVAAVTLFGENVGLGDVALDGEQLDAKRMLLTPGQLRIEGVPESFELTISTRINPKDNTTLSGLYLSSGIFCTQCEAEGFRRITYYPDRPDILARFTTRIEAKADMYPVLLSNGNLVERGALADGYHFAVWEDPFPKPSYLYALVAGDLACIDDRFETCSGRDIALQIYVQKQNTDKCAHAMRSLKKAMAWDEQVFGREYDLDQYMIVAVDDFNMGAMENKGLNIFNSKFVLASPKSATDHDFLNIEGVIAHEYFHNWTGNRVTCRDWFQLSLKEGLTVFRDQEFSADANSRAVQRIDDVRLLRQFQFREDAGPMAHPVRPESYIEINNFYTVTVYNKGAEVVRMLHTLLGKQAFRKGMDLYFQRHDGQAVTCDDFVAAMADASGRDLEQFKRWYAQAGTPELTVVSDFDATSNEYRVTISQRTPPTPGQRQKEALHIPILAGLLDDTGTDITGSVNSDCEMRSGSVLLELQQEVQTFVFRDVPARPVLSVLRDFSAPVRIKPFHSMAECVFLMRHDSDPFNRWDAAFSMSEEIITDLAERIGNGDRPELDKGYCAAMRHNLVSTDTDPALLALALQLPTESHLAQAMDVVDPDSLHRARQYVKKELARRLQQDLVDVYRANQLQEPYQLTPDHVGRRSLVNVCVGYLTSIAEEAAECAELCRTHYFRATNMTDAVGAVSAAVHLTLPLRDELLDHFESAWNKDPLVMDKWLAMQAGSSAADTFERVETLRDHPVFSLSNPNKVRALIGSFCHNHYHFHHPSGRGYRFLTGVVQTLDSLNPQIAARLLTPLISWKRYDRNRQKLMRNELERLSGLAKLSRDVFEIVKRSLESD